MELFPCHSCLYNDTQKQPIDDHSMEPHPIDSERKELLEWIKKIAESSKYTYGSRRMKHALNALGYPIGRNKTRRLMKEAQIWVRYRKKYKVTTHSKHKKPLFNNELNRRFQLMCTVLLDLVTNHRFIHYPLSNRST